MQIVDYIKSIISVRGEIFSEFRCFFSLFYFMFSQIEENRKVSVAKFRSLPEDWDEPGSTIFLSIIMSLFFFFQTIHCYRRLVKMGNTIH